MAEPLSGFASRAGPSARGLALGQTTAESGGIRAHRADTAPIGRSRSGLGQAERRSYVASAVRSASLSTSSRLNEPSGHSWRSNIAVGVLREHERDDAEVVGGDAHRDQPAAGTMSFWPGEDRGGLEVVQRDQALDRGADVVAGGDALRDPPQRLAGLHDDRGVAATAAESPALAGIRPARPNARTVSSARSTTAVRARRAAAGGEADRGRRTGCRAARRSVHGRRDRDAWPVPRS